MYVTDAAMLCYACLYSASKLRILNVIFTYDGQHCNTVVVHQSVGSCALLVVNCSFFYILVTAYGA